jgi:hypothetical protein
MKAIIWMNAIKNNPVTTEDVNIAEKIFGPDVATLKGKMTHRPPIPIIEDRIEVPRELITTQYSVTLCLDGMKVNDISFLTTISKKSDVLNCTIRPTLPRKHLPQMFATSAPNLHPGRITSYYNSL